MDNTSLGERMKGYENINRTHITPRTPIIIRVDGKAFHSYTKGFNKPWDKQLQSAMNVAAVGLLNNVSGADIAYIQSDEISLVLNTYKKFETQPWFGGNVQKISSVAASLATGYFNLAAKDMGFDNKLAFFDGRCFAVPREDVVNYFIFRQRDAIRNSIQGLAQSKFSQNQLQNKDTTTMKNMLKDQHNIDWDADISITNQRGWCVVRKVVSELNRSTIVKDEAIPEFSQDRNYISKFLTQEEV
jgi:tRNA(His) 5'-end guanylyltransferase